jgi:hypothetical protein
MGDENDHGEYGTTCKSLVGDWPKLTMPSHGTPSYYKPKNTNIMPCTSSMIFQATNDMGGRPINIVNATIQSQIPTMNPNLPNDLGIQVQN